MDKIKELKTKLFEFNSKQRYLNIFIATYNRKIYLERCILSIIASTSLPYRIIVGDDMSNDGTIEILDKYKKNGRIYDYFLSAQKLGTANMYNSLIKKYQIERDNLFVITNDDMYFRYMWDLVALDIILNFPDCGIVSLYDYTNFKFGINCSYTSHPMAMKIESTGLGASVINYELYKWTDGFQLRQGKTMGFFATKFCNQAKNSMYHRNGIYSTVLPFALHMDHVKSLLSERENLTEYIQYRKLNKR
jgi:glycosyltransferase involved in cell wall biosynthesis